MDYTISIDDTLLEQVGETFVADVIALKTAEATLLVRKQADYGPHNIGRCPTGPMSGLVVRLHDKVARLAHLTRKGRTPKYESLADTAIDIANYGTIASMVINGFWPGQDSDE